MASQSKPDVNVIWAETGEVSPFDAAKQRLGYIDEIPFFDNFNWLMQQHSKFMKHVNQEGVPVWDANTIYSLLGLAKAPRDGNLYRCVVEESSGNEPVNGSGIVHSDWVRVTFTAVEISTNIIKQATETEVGVARIATETETLNLTDNSTIITPRKLGLGFTASFGLTGYIKLPRWLGGFMMQWGFSALTNNIAGTVINYPAAYPTTQFATVGSAMNVTTYADAFELISVGSQSSFTAAIVSSGPGSSVVVAGNVSWVSFGR